ncbi:hypothetical protein RB195_021611 [Necator americanus]|uniref:Zinc metalloproteinase n=1 Tax=Necator americanus TaxID=51031 RepID=A0ABR1EEH5_NECAM
MWVLLQFLLLVACARAGGDEFQALGLIYEVNFTALGNIHTELRKMGEQVIESLNISVEEKDRLKKEHKILNQPLSGLLQDIVKNKSDIFRYVFQGDIILNKEQGGVLQKDIQGLQEVPYLPPMWSQGIKYSFHKRANKKLRDAFKRAAEAWQRDTCVNITEDDNESGDRVVVAGAPFCASYLGKRGGKQVIFLSGFCETFRSAAHELGHTLGLFQQESREDRDDYVKIVTENLEPNQVYMAFKQSQYTNNVSGIGYDFGSIMQAGARSGSINRNRTIDSIDPKYRKNLRSESISFADLYLVNKRYNCSESCPNFLKCKNGGFQHPRNCSICLCPSGYAGPLCGHKPPACGSVLNATVEETTFTVKFKIKKGRTDLDGYKRCTYWIKSPNDTRIEMEIEPQNSPFNDTDLYCNEAGVEVKAIKDQRLTGYKFCSNGDRYNITSHSNLVPIIAFNRDPLPEKVSFTGSKFLIRYRYRVLREDEKESHVNADIVH